MTQRTVNDRQLEVLTWIGAGCPVGVMVGDSHKTTAVALQSRRLAKVTRKRGVWGAAITDAGHHFLEHGEYPDGHWPVPVLVPGPGRTEPRRRPSRAPAGQKATGLRPVDQMIVDVVAAGGRLTVAVGPGRRWEHLVSSATRYGKVPEGKTLTVERGSTYSEQVLVLATPQSG